MQLVERHVIEQTDSRFAAIDAAAFASKNLYNAANSVVRQSFIGTGVYLDYHEMRRRMMDHEAYQAPPARVAQWVGVDVEWALARQVASSLDADPAPFYDATQPVPAFSGRRVQRGRYRAADGAPIDADVNGASNKIRNAAPEAFAQGRGGCVAYPVRLAA
jgi:hypothetical protein